MKKNISYLIILILLFFCGVSGVEASGLTCEYDIVGAGTPKYYLVLTQDDDGLVYLYKNETSDNLSSDSWEIIGSAFADDLKEVSSAEVTTAKFRISNSSDEKIQNNKLVSCPEKVYRDRDTLIYTFNDNRVIGEGHPNGELIDTVNSSFKELNSTSPDVSIDDSDIATIGYGQTCGSLELDNYWIKNPENNKSCLYATQIVANIKDQSGKVEKKTSCIIVQVVEENSKLVTYTNFDHWTGANTVDTTGITEVCSKSIYAKYTQPSGDEMPKDVAFSTVKESNQKYQGILTVRRSTEGIDEAGNDITSCDQLFSPELLTEIEKYLNIIRIAVPILVFVLGTLDFAKAVFSNDEGMKKAQKAFMKRVVIAIAFFMIPTILTLLLNTANDVWGWNSGLCIK